MKILVCGGRTFGERSPNYRTMTPAQQEDDDNRVRRQRGLVKRTLYGICDEHGLWNEPDQLGNTTPRDVTIIHGKAKGADSIADEWAAVNWLSVEEYEADWATHGKAAGPIRNQQMLDEGKPDMVVAFSGRTGTADMVRRARKAGISVVEVKE
jgi:hypothetical protein